MGHLQTYLHCLARNCEDHILSKYLKRGWSVQYIVEVTAAPSLPTAHKCLGLCFILTQFMIEITLSSVFTVASKHRYDIEIYGTYVTGGYDRKGENYCKIIKIQFRSAPLVIISGRLISLSRSCPRLHLLPHLLDYFFFFCLFF